MDAEQICSFGRVVIETEARMIKNLLDRLDHYFVKACEHLYKCKGRVVVMGVGKSGHIAKKIAATLASTGCPAFFIHPSEARHGDMGMITQDDVVMVLSYSGESEEIVSILPFLKNLQIPIISMTGKSQSTLAKASNVNIDVSVEKEACPLGLAPTSSTTAALVMGDAIAMTLSQLRNFTENDFARSHPGGALGRRLLLKVEEIMHQDNHIPVVKHNVYLKDALIEMTQKKLGLTTVVNQENKLVGIFTDGDVRRAFDKDADINSTFIHEVMSCNPKTISPDLLAANALQIMEKYKITSLVVTNNDTKPIGVLHIHDVLRAGIM